MVLDVRTDVFTYLKGHLPGAEYLNTETVRASEGGIPTRLLSAGAYRELFGRLGIAYDQPVVIYSAGETHNIDATFVAWLLAAFGHPKVYVLDGGFFKWQLEQRPVVQPYPRIPATSFPDHRFQPEAASLADVQAAMRNGGLLVDERPPDQYAGEAGSQMRHGHIPGAVNHYWQDDLTQKASATSEVGRRLRRAYAAQGIVPGAGHHRHCNSATEASHVFFTLRHCSAILASVSMWARGLVGGEHVAASGDRTRTIGRTGDRRAIERPARGQRSHDGRNKATRRDAKRRQDLPSIARSSYRPFRPRPLSPYLIAIPPELPRLPDPAGASPIPRSRLSTLERFCSRARGRLVAGDDGADLTPGSPADGPRRRVAVRSAAVGESPTGPRPA